MSIEKPENLGEVILRMANSEDKVYVIPPDVGADIADKLGNAIHEAVSKIRAKERSCPHADPFVYCADCVVSPCPIGLGNTESVNTPHEPSKPNEPEKV